ncbi:MAG: HAD family hydrolase [Shinella sp.]|nr:MAG: HAD family hydrolase [Shinella sp.]
MNPSAVVFDIGGVLIDWNPVHLYGPIFRDEQATEAFLRDICNAAWNEQFDAGKPFADGIAELISAYPDKAELICIYWDRWEEMLGGEIAGTVDILRRLKNARIPVHAISNFSAETFPRAVAVFPFLDQFDTLVVSGREGLIKPDPEIFHLFLRRAGLDAADCIFIDDKADNIAAAASLGFHTLHFKDAGQLEERLVSLGLLTPAVEGAGDE